MLTSLLYLAGIATEYKGYPSDPPKTFSVTKFLFVGNYVKSQGWLKSFWKKIYQLFFYCPWKRSKSFWIFVFFFYWIKTAIFQNNTASCFVIIFTNVFKGFVKLMTKHDAVLFWKIAVFIQLKKNSNKDSKTFAPFPWTIRK